MNIGYLGGMTAVVPTDDFWRRKNFDLQLEQQQRQKEALELSKQQHLQKAIAVNPSKQHRSVQEDYDKGVRERAAKIQALAMESKGNMTKDLQDAVLDLQMFDKKFSSISERLRSWESIPDNKLSQQGKDIKGKINSGIPIPEIEKWYTSTYNNRLMPLMSDGQGGIDQSVFIIQKPDYMKEIYADAKGTDVVIEGQKVNIAGKSGQEVIKTSFKTKKDAEAYMKKTGKKGILSAEDIALSKLGDEAIFESALKSNADEFVNQYDAIYNSFSPEQKEVVDSRPEIKERLSKEILAKILANKVTPEIKTDYIFGYAPTQGRSSGNGGRNGGEVGYYKNIQDKSKQAISVGVSSVPTTVQKNTPLWGAEFLKNYAKTIGVSSGNWLEADPNGQVLFKLTKPTPKDQAFVANGVSIDLLSGIPKEVKTKLGGYNLPVTYVDQEIILRKPDGSDLTFKELAKKSDAASSVVPYYQQSYKVNIAKLKKDLMANGYTDTDAKAITSQLQGIYRSNWNMLQDDMSTFDEQLRQKAKSFESFGGQTEPMNTQEEGTIKLSW